MRDLRATRQVALAVLCCLALPTALLRAQQQNTDARLRQQQQELEKLRTERRTLERRMGDLQQSAQSLTEEVRNLDRQADATSRLVRTLDRQLGAITGDVESVTQRLVQTEDELLVRRAMLHRRVREVYKRGPMYELEVLLSSRSFGELVGRYRYLKDVVVRDRQLVARVETLRGEISGKRTELVTLQDEIQRNRREKAQEESRLRTLEQQRQRRLATVKRTAEQTKQRLAQLERDERRLTSLIASLEEARRRAASAPGARPSAPSTLTTADFGKLAWPVEGSILYRFGRVVNPNNTTTRWNGIGIGASVGTPVKAVAAGEVMIAETIGTYGPTVIIQHGGGDYSIYGSLARITVKKGSTVAKGDDIGTVGAADPELPPHLHFEIRPGGRAVDPLDWLRQQR